MKMLLHTCCAPCLSGSRIQFEEEDFELTSLWYNPNIHPFSEHQRRLHTLERYLFLDALPLHIISGYEMNRYISGQIEHLKEYGYDPISNLMSDDDKKRRCEFCYDLRIGITAEYAKENGYDTFNTTLLLSKHQDHEAIRNSCSKMSEIHEIEFIYKDLRKNWKDSIRISKEMELYRQKYCGCIYSEHERIASE